MQDQKVTSAVRAPMFPLRTVGVTPDGVSIIFNSADYDGNGNVRGRIAVLGEGSDGFYAIGLPGSYLPHLTSGDRARFRKLAQRFADGAAVTFCSRFPDRMSM